MRPPRGPKLCSVVILLLAGCGRFGFVEPDATVVDSGADVGPMDSGPDAGDVDTGRLDSGADTIGVDAPFDSGADTGAADTSIADTGVDAAPDAGRCAATCDFDLLAGTSSCSPGAPIMTSPITASETTAIIDMTGMSALNITLDACDVTGFSFHLGDSPTNGGFGGDGGSSSNDAELHISGGNLDVYGNDLVSGVNVLNETNALPTSGCGVYSLVVADQSVETPTMGIVGPELLRIDPATDTEGTPDALWYLGANRTYGSALRSGGGLRSLRLCFEM